MDAPRDVVVSGLGAELLSEALLLCVLDSAVVLGALRRDEAVLLLLLKGVVPDVSRDEGVAWLTVLVTPGAVAELGSEPVVPAVEWAEEL